MVTIKDISSKTGYSIATVSKALNHTGRIPEETRKIVLKTAEELGYVPNYSARFLKTTESWTIGIIYEGIANLGLFHPYFSRVLEYFRKEVEAKGYDMLFLSKNFGAHHLSYLEHARMKGVDGILVVCGPMGDPSFTEVFESNLPSVVIDHISPSTTTVTSKSDVSIHEMIEKLKACGHKEIAYVHGSTNSFIGKSRMDNFMDAMHNHGLKVSDKLLVEARYYSRNDGQDAVSKLMTLKKTPSAIFCASDDVALGVIDGLKQLNIKVPEDVSVIGFDGIKDDVYGEMKLGFIKQEMKSIGVHAAHEILNQMNLKEKVKNKVVYIDTTFEANDTVSKCK
ncbi:MAG: LacI family DNA-binding transcriptional regulator [Acholeplasmataceae bacterium]